MRRNISIYTVCVLVFLLLLSVAGSLSGLVSDVVYYLSFVVAVAIGMRLGRPRPVSETGESYQPAPYEYLTLDKKGAKLLLPTVFPSVALIFLLSYLTSLLLFAATGQTSTTEVGDSLGVAVLVHALVPALLEESLFRFLPMYLLSGFSRRVTVFISSLYFALVHNSFFSMPYAFFAGVIFITLDIVTESVWPSVILHFINNAVSVLWIFYSEDGGFTLGFCLTLGTLALVSVGVIFLMRREYKAALRGFFLRDEKYIPSYEPLMLIVPTFIAAVGELISF